MKKLIIATFATAVAVTVGAQEFGSAAAAPAAAPAPAPTPAPAAAPAAAVAPATAAATAAIPPPVGQGAGVEQMQQALAEEIAPAPTAIKAIKQYLATKDWGTGYDEKRDRIVVEASIEFDIKNPKVSTDFVKLRKAKMDELCLMGKANIIESIMSKMSGSRILEIPGNPIAKQLEKETREMDKALAVARENLERLDKNLAEKLAERGDLSATEAVSVMSSWFINAEKENIAQKLDEQKKADYAEAKQLFEDAQKAYKELNERAEVLKGTVKSKMKTQLSSISEMPIYGCTVLQQAESISRGANGNYKYQIAILYAWSGEMMKASAEILKGKAVKFKPGKKSIKAWLKSKAEKNALSQWMGPRQFIDDKGNMWFIGISAAPVMDDSDDNNIEREKAELEAKAEVMFALYADARSSKKLEKLTQTKVGANGEKQYQTLEDFCKDQSEAFQDIMISGNAPLYSDTLRHEPSGLDVQVVVYGVNTGSAKALSDIQARATALGIEVNTYQEMIRGRQKRLQQLFNISKNNPEARATGAAAANAAVSSQVEKNRPKRQTGFREIKGPAQPAATTGELKTGTAITTDDDDDDEV